MKKRLMLVSALTALCMVGATGVAYAWTFNFKGRGVCQADGTFKITWTVDNRTEAEPMTVTDSNIPAGIPVGSVIPAKGQKGFVQVVDGKTTKTITGTIKGNWPSDQNKVQKTSKVKLSTPCPQPPVQQPPVTPPTDGGRGAGAPVEPVAAPVAAPQVVIPQGSVNAGVGIDSQTGAYVGLGASMLVFAEGIRRLTKQLLARR